MISHDQNQSTGPIRPHGLRSISDFEIDAGGFDGEWALDGSTPFRWSASAGAWVPSVAYSAGTFSKLCELAGTESAPSDYVALGFTVSGSGGTLSSAEVGGRDYAVIDCSASNSHKTHLVRSDFSSGDGIYIQGWLRFENVTTGTHPNAQIPYLRDGSKTYHVHAEVSTSQAKFIGGGSHDSSANDIVSAPVFYEFLKLPAGTNTPDARAMFRVGRAANWAGHAIASDMSSAGGHTDLTIGDNSTSGKSKMSLGAGLRVFKIS